MFQACVGTISACIFLGPWYKYTAVCAFHECAYCRSQLTVTDLLTLVLQ